MNSAGPAMQPDTLAHLLGIIQSTALSLADIEALRDALHALSPLKAQPVDRVRWVPIDQISPNDYNPNAVALNEMKLFLHSIEQDGYSASFIYRPPIYDSALALNASVGYKFAEVPRIQNDTWVFNLRCTLSTA